MLSLLLCHLARPKSPSFTEEEEEEEEEAEEEEEEDASDAVPPRVCSMTLAGFMSLCTTPKEWA